MVLTIGEQKWHLHFHVEDAEDDETRARRGLPPLPFDTVTKCLVHTGPCIQTHLEPRYCVNGRVGTAFCSKKDQYVRKVGMQVALTKAISHLPEEARRNIWKAYWKLVRRPKETPAQFRQRKALESESTQAA